MCMIKTASILLRLIALSQVTGGGGGHRRHIGLRLDCLIPGAWVATTCASSGAAARPCAAAAEQ